jgi:uncharacterized membrane protein
MENMQNTSPLVLILAAVFIFAIFLLFREINLWYFKINKMIKKQTAILFMLTKIYENNSGVLSEKEQEEINKTLNE